jgi:hypothetical protein
MLVVPTVARAGILGGAVLSLLIGSCARERAGSGDAGRRSVGDVAGAGVSAGGVAGALAASAGAAGGGRGGVSIDAGIDVEIVDAGEPDGFEACEVEESDAEAPGLDIYIVLDRSGTMAQDPEGQNTDGVPDGATLGDCPIDVSQAPPSNSRWCLTTNALSKFYTSPTERDVRVAFQVMTPAENYDVCGQVPENPHATARVDLSQLPVTTDHALISVLEADFPRLGTSDGVSSSEYGTRIEAALNGIVRFTAAHQEATRTTIGVLITDGDPNHCQDDDIEALGRIPRDHYDATGIPTFIIGMTGATADNLETLARFGGAPEHTEYCDSSHSTCHYWTVGDGEPEAFRDLLATIQQAATLPCEYILPRLGGGRVLDANLVQVKYAPRGQPAEQIYKVAGTADCDASLGGWFYDDNEHPKRILLCPRSCELVNASTIGGVLSVAYGCTPLVR